MSDTNKRTPTPAELIGTAKREAKRLLKALSSTDPVKRDNAAERFLSLPIYDRLGIDDLDPQKVSLKHAQEVIAQEQGVDRWDLLLRAIRRGETSGIRPTIFPVDAAVVRALGDLGYTFDASESDHVSATFGAHQPVSDQEVYSFATFDASGFTAYAEHERFAVFPESPDLGRGRWGGIPADLTGVASDGHGNVEVSVPAGDVNDGTVTVALSRLWAAAMAGVRSGIEEVGDRDSDTLERLKLGRIEVAWIRLGEGRDGDYDPTDPDDVELLRLDVSVHPPAEGTGAQTASYCTALPVHTPKNDRLKALSEINDVFDRLLPVIDAGFMSADTIAQRLSWVEPSWLTGTGWLAFDKIVQEWDEGFRASQAREAGEAM